LTKDYKDYNFILVLNNAEINHGLQVFNIYTSVMEMIVAGFM